MSAASNAVPAASPVVRFAEAEMPTQAGTFRLVVYRMRGQDPSLPPDAVKEHLAIVSGDPADGGGLDVLARVHSECWTGETLGSLKCDCREQLDQALEAIGKAGRGVIVYLRQEGRGIGLGNKIRAYALQNEGADTVEANERLGFAPDLRSYELAAAILKDLGVASVALMTNSPDKLDGLRAAGVEAVRVPHWTGVQAFNQGYLEVKRQKLGHLE